jgi:hypothetical protein
MPRCQHVVVASVILLLAIRANAFDFEFARGSSSAGQFSVLLPKPFAELPPNTGVNPAAAFRPTRSFVIGGKPAAGVIFLATKMVYSSPDDARSAVTNVIGAEPPGFKRAYMKRVDGAGLSGTEIRSVSSSTVGYRRILQSGDTVFILAVEAPAAKDDEIKQPARKFLDSLTLTKPQT